MFSKFITYLPKVSEASLNHFFRCLSHTAPPRISSTETGKMASKASLVVMDFDSFRAVLLRLEGGRLKGISFFWFEGFVGSDRDGAAHLSVELGCYQNFDKKLLVRYLQKPDRPKFMSLNIVHLDRFPPSSGRLISVHFETQKPSTLQANIKTLVARSRQLFHLPIFEAKAVLERAARAKALEVLILFRVGQGTVLEIGLLWGVVCSFWFRALAKKQAVHREPDEKSGENLRCSTHAETDNSLLIPSQLAWRPLAWNEEERTTE